MKKIATVAAEPSGDILGGHLMRHLHQIQPDIDWSGIGGTNMTAQGLRSAVPMSKLSVMGLVEVLKHLRELLRIRRELTKTIINEKPSLFIGIDAPDFNLKLEQHLRQQGIKTVHYVCPTVWAWRTGRVKQLRRSADLILCIFPFEVEFLKKHQVEGTFIGHPLADEFPLKVDTMAARDTLGLRKDEQVLAVLPGSRHTEISQLSKPFLLAIKKLKQVRPKLQIVCPFATESTRDAFLLSQKELIPDIKITAVLNQSKTVMAAADVVLTASGTATFEVLLSKKPMVVGYKVQAITYWIVRGLKLIKTPYFAMANLLSEKPFAAEFIQYACNPDNLFNAVNELLEDERRRAQIATHYTKVHQSMRMNASQKAAEAIIKLLGTSQ